MDSPSTIAPHHNRDGKYVGEMAGQRVLMFFFQHVPLTVVNIVKGVEYTFHCVGKGCLCKPVCGELMGSNMIQLYQLTNEVQLYEIVVS